MRWTKASTSDLLERLQAAYPDARCALDHQDPFQLVVATILSAQCTDARVNLTTPALFRRYPDPAALAAADPAELEALIRPTGFYRNKAKSLLGLGQALVARHEGVVPSDPKALASLPGVGQKTANVVLANAFAVPALAVDTHIFRVARRLGLSKANTPEKVEDDLTARFPRELWIALHHQLIWHGRRLCHARGPVCGTCPFLDLCPTGRGLIKDPHTGEAVLAGVAKGTAPVADVVGKGPQRVVSLVPSFTELLAQWGLAARLAGRTKFCVEPSWLRASVPTVGGTKTPDLQAIRDLAPDLVLMERDENTRETWEQLQAWGIPTEVLSIRSLKDVAAGWRHLGGLFGVEAVAEARATALEARVRPSASGPRTLILVWPEPWVVAGTDSCLADLVRQGGFVPVGGMGWPRPSETELQALDPEVVLLPTDPFPWKAKQAARVQALFPQARVRILEGRALTWCLSRTEDGLDLMEAQR